MENIKCDHCHLEFGKDVMIKDDEHYFCCGGCQGVFHLLSENGLDSFYDKAGSTKLSRPVEEFEDSITFDTPSFYDKFVSKDKDGFSEVSLIIEGIHCSACVWLNEKALGQMDGVIEAYINHTNNKAKITWSDSNVKLSQIIDMIRAIGYDAFPYDPSIQEVRADKARKDYYMRLAVAVFGSMNIMWIAVAQYAGYFTGITQEIKTILNTAEWILSTPVLFYSGWNFFKGSYYGIKNHIVNMDILVATGATLTYIYSIYITLNNSGEAYFDSVSMIITFVLIGKFLETLSKKSAADTLDVMSKNIPSEISVIENENIVLKNVNDVEIGDTIMLRLGERAVIDGILLEGESNFDESSLSGESEPILKKVGDKIVSGTTSIDGAIRYSATKDFTHSTLSNIVSLLESAIAKKPRIEKIANRLSEHFSLAILLASFATFLVWFFGGSGFEVSFMIAISVIVIACPCALALATPVASLVGFSLSLKKGILFKESAMLESMAQAEVIVFDKTGTLTNGKPSVIKHEQYENIDKKLIYSLTSSSTHPISNGVSEYLKDESNELLALNNLEQVRGRGIKASFNKDRLLGGNALFLKEHGIIVDDSGEGSHFFVAFKNTLVAKFTLKDELKDDALNSVERIKKFGLLTIILSGDREESVKEVASALGIKEYHYGLSPEQKSEFVQKLQQSKKVVMAGDGINDILALANADIAIAMGSGSDIAIEVSDVVLLNNSLVTLADSFAIARRTYSLIKQNLAISLLYNAITIPLAMMGYIIPLIAAISMSFSSLLVVGNSLRIKWKY
ncbi:MAG: cadmium-translocating P-type ATPase [Helicobacteraceae bacterium]|nr:cadmium-translocating P-type ATPase [Helicobacteraceae bacterium]